MGCGQIIKAYMEYIGEDTQTSLAHKIGIPQSTLSGYLNERRFMPEDVLIKLVDYFKISTDFAHGLTEFPERLTGISDNEKSLIAAYRTLTPEQREFLIGVLNLMRKK